MNDLEKYLNNRKESLENQNKDICESIDKLTNENIQIEIKITELSKNLDTTFEVFSPNSMMGDYNVSEIDKLKKISHENTLHIQSLKKKQDKIEKELVDLVEAINSYNGMKDKVDSMDNDKTLMINKNQISQRELEKLAVDISELEIGRFEKTMSQEITQILESLLYKEKLCENFIEMDANRSKMELIEIKEGLNTLQNKVYDFMFHVKHSIMDNSFYLINNINTHIKKYNKSSDIVSVTGIGDDVIMPIYDIQNNLRIIDEIIDNSIFHGHAKHINIHVSIIDLIEKSEILEIVDNLDDKKNEDNMVNINQEKIIDYDLKQSDNNVKCINITISDDGCGFDDCNHSYFEKKSGLAIVKKRLELYSGEITIKSNYEFGTTVNYSYNYLQ